MVRRAAFLDRDGVLVRNVLRDGRHLAPRTMAEFAIDPDAPDGVRRLQEAGFILVVVTNQPDLGHGLIAPPTLEAMHDALRATVPVSTILTCPHRQDEGCECRKPRPGLLLRAAADFGLDLASSWMVGDRATDVKAGRAAGCRTILIDHGVGEVDGAAPIATVRSFAAAVAYILQSTDEEGGS